MATKKYTEHRLTPSMLRQLSQYRNGRRDGPSGTTHTGFENRGLAKYCERYQDSRGYFSFTRFTITRDEAAELVNQARREGW